MATIRITRADVVQSAKGAFTVPMAVSVRDLVYLSGADAADIADNTDLTKLARAIVIEKPTSTTATLAYSGEISGFAGLTPAAELFLGVSGALVESAGLPTAANSIVQRIGAALNATTILFDFSQPIQL